MESSLGADRATLSEGGTEGRTTPGAAGDGAVGLLPAELGRGERPDGRRSVSREAEDRALQPRDAANLGLAACWRRTVDRPKWSSRSSSLRLVEALRFRRSARSWPCIPAERIHQGMPQKKQRLEDICTPECVANDEGTRWSLVASATSPASMTSTGSDTTVIPASSSADANLDTEPCDDLGACATADHGGAQPAAKTAGDVRHRRSP